MAPHESSHLARQLRGELISPADSTYDEHRKIWNGSIDRRPDLIARCADAGDVATVVRYAADTGTTPFAVRGGGHSFPGHSVCDGGLVLDLGPMKRIHVDPEKRTARVEPGVLWGELDVASQEYGLATVGGIVTHTGVAGLTLGGGIGWLQRKHGLTIDQLLSVDLITASGEPVRASDEENADLFWGVRGGGGNFGVVTEFTFRLHPLRAVLAGPILWRIEHSARILRFYREWIADAPDELMTIVMHRRVPPLDMFPAELHGEFVVGVGCCWSGEIDEGERILEPLRKFLTPAVDACVPKSYVEHQASLDPSFPHGWHFYLRACDVAELNDEVIETVVEYANRMQSPQAAFPIWQMGGAVARVADADTAFNGRAAGHTFNLSAITATAEGFDEERAWAQEFWSALAPHHTSVYVNFLWDEGEERVREAYGAQKYDRLKALKRHYDPGNLFRLNQNIAP